MKLLTSEEGLIVPVARSVKVEDLPSAPTNVTLTRQDNNDTLIEWTHGGGASSFVLYVSLAGGNFLPLVSGLSGAARSHNDLATYPAGADVQYHVVARNSFGPSEPAVSSSMVANPVPSAPTDVAATVQGTNDVLVTATRGDTTNDSHRIEASVNAGPYGSLVTGLPATNVSHQDTTARDEDDTVRYRVFAVNEAGDSAGVESNEVTPNPAAQEGNTPDLSGLPQASGQSVSSLPAGLSSAGGTALDPLTGARVWRITDNGTPSSGAFTTDYADGPVAISRETTPGSGVHLFWFRSAGGTYYVGKFTRGSGPSDVKTFSAAGIPQPEMDLNTTWAKLASTPTHIYVYSGSQLRRYLVNPTTMTASVAESGTNFPVSMNGGAWLQQDPTDRYFVKLNGSGAVYRFDAQADDLISRSISGLDEPHISQNSQHAYILSENFSGWWDYINNTLSDGLDVSGLASPGHHASMYDWILFSDVNGALQGQSHRAISRLQTPTTASAIGTTLANNFHAAGQWCDQNNDAAVQSNRLLAYALWGTFGDTGFSGSLASRFMTFANGTGDARILCNNYHDNNGTNYWDMPKGSPSPDGKAVIFTGLGQGSGSLSSGNHHVFIAEVPLAA